MVLQHLDDRKYAVEKDPRSPGGQGYTGLEALLSYVYDQTTSTSIFDQNNHILKVGAFVSPCANYASEETLKKDPSLDRQCASRLGPIQPGLNYPDVTKRATPEQAKERAARKRADGNPGLPLPEAPAPVDAPAPSAPATPATPSVPAVPGVPSTPSVPTPTVPGVPPIDLPPLPGTGGGNDRGGGGTSPLPPLPKLSAKTSNDPQAQARLLDYLLAP
jgi:phospholipid/cholesterol/gamma-HCH transport system substrate-binding protein